MINSIVKKIVSKQISKNNIEQDEIELYEFGYRILLEKCLIYIITIQIALIFDSFFIVILFYLFFIPLRKYVGGYHTDNFCKCVLFSSGVLIFYIVLIRILCIWIEGNYIIGLEIFIAPMILKIGPVEHENNPLSKNEKRIYKMKAIILYFLHIFCEIICGIFSIDFITISIVVIHLIIYFSLLICNIKD